MPLFSKKLEEKMDPHNKTYLNYLVYAFHEHGVNCSAPEFTPMLKFYVQHNGFHKALQRFATSMPEIHN